MTSAAEKGKQTRIAELIHAYRSRGPPGGRHRPPSPTVCVRHPDLELRRYGLTFWDLDREFPTGGFGDAPSMRLRDSLAPTP
jgi:2-oxoglutarate dehydrogenase E1 component